MSDKFAPKKMPMRKAKAFGGAHDRIVRTERQRDQEKGRANMANSHMRQMSDMVTSPIMEQMMGMLQRIVAEDFAKMLSEKLLEELGDGFSDMLKAEIAEELLESRHLSRSVKALLAGIASKADMSYDTAQDIHDMSIANYINFQVPAFRLAFTKYVPQYELRGVRR